MRLLFRTSLALLMLCAGVVEALGASNLPLDLARFRIFEPAAEVPVKRLVPPAEKSAVERRVVDYARVEQPGTVVIDTQKRFLYLVMSGNKAIRYGIGVGRPGYAWSGVQTISQKKEWPDWIPPKEMIQRQPNLPRFVGGGPGNPLGARALYLGSTLYRIHGSNMPDTIGQAVSSGCFRMKNEDVTDLYARVGVGTQVIVLP